MNGDWRHLLKEKVKAIRERGGPQKPGELIVVPVDMNDSEFEMFSAFTGWLNARPHGDSPAGTLEIRPLSRGKDGLARLSFLFHPEPPVNFGTAEGSSSGPEQRRVMPGVKFDSIKSGVDFETLPWFAFPTDRNELSSMKTGHRHDAVVPVSPAAAMELDAGSPITFFEAASDAFGTPYYVPGGEALGFTLTRVRDEEYDWGGKKLYYVAWDPDVVNRQKSQSSLTECKAERQGKSDA